MQFKVDENLPLEIKDLLVDAGYAAVTVLEQKLGGEADQRVIQICQGEKRSLVTLDWDFADIRACPPRDYHGIVVLSPPNQSKRTLIAMVSRMIPLLKKESLAGFLWIVESNRVRIRTEKPQ